MYDTEIELLLETAQHTDAAFRAVEDMVRRVTESCGCVVNAAPATSGEMLDNIHGPMCIARAARAEVPRCEDCGGVVAIITSSSELRSNRCWCRR